MCSRGVSRCSVGILMGKTDPDAPRHAQQSMILLPLDTPGVKVLRMLPGFGYDDAPHGHGEVELKDVRVPVENILHGEGRSEEHTSELQSLMRISYAVYCLKKKT